MCWLTTAAVNTAADALRTDCGLRVNRHDSPNVQDGMDDEDAQALRAEGLDPDDPDVRPAIDLVRWELSLFPLRVRVRTSWPTTGD